MFRPQQSRKNSKNKNRRASSSSFHVARGFFSERHHHDNPLAWSKVLMAHVVHVYMPIVGPTLDVGFGRELRGVGFGVLGVHQLALLQEEEEEEEVKGGATAAAAATRSRSASKNMRRREKERGEAGEMCFLCERRSLLPSASRRGIRKGLEGLRPRKSKREKKGAFRSLHFWTSQPVLEEASRLGLD